jgi:hypothetical protein
MCPKQTCGDSSFEHETGDLPASVDDHINALEHIATILKAAVNHASKGHAYSRKDVERIADILMKAPGVNNLEDAIALSERSKRPMMLARAVTVELQRRRKKHDSSQPKV